MAFCKYCGRELKDGEVCGCQATPAPAAAPAPEAAPAPAAAPAPEAAPAPAAAPTPAPAPAPAPATASESPKIVISVDAGQISSTAKQVIKEYPKMWKQFATAGREMMASVNTLALVFLVVIQALASSIFCLCVVGRINSALSGVMGLLGGKAKSSAVSGVKAFFLTLLFSLIFSVIWAALVWVAGMIAGAKMNLNQALAAAAIRSVVCAPVTIVAAVMFFINPLLGFILFFAAILLVICASQEALKAVDGMTDNKSVYVTFGVSLVFIGVFAVLGVKMLPAYVPANLGSDILGMLKNFI